MDPNLIIQHTNILNYLFCDNVSMFICELFLAYLLPRKIFNLITLWTEDLQINFKKKKKTTINFNHSFFLLPSKLRSVERKLALDK